MTAENAETAEFLGGKPGVELIPTQQDLAEFTKDQDDVKKLAAQVDFAKENLVHVRWWSVPVSGFWSRRVTLEREITEGEHGTVIKFYMKIPEGLEATRGIQLRSNFFAVPKNVQVVFGDEAAQPQSQSAPGPRELGDAMKLDAGSGRGGKAEVQGPVGEIRSFGGHENTISQVAFAADGLRAVSASLDGTVRVWELETGRELLRFQKHGDRVNCVRTLHDGQQVVSGGDDAVLRLWNLETGEQIREYGADLRYPDDMGYVETVAISPDGRLILSGHDVVRLRPDGGGTIGSGYKGLVLWDLGTGREIRRFSDSSRKIAVAVFCPSGAQALSGDMEGNVYVWNVETGTQASSFKVHKKGVRAIAVGPDGKWAVSGSVDGDIVMWNIETGKEIRCLSGHSGRVFSVAVSPDGRLALSAGADETDCSIRVWQLDTGKETHRFEGHRNGCYSVAFSPDGHRALSGGADTLVRLWGLPMAGK